MMGRKSFRRGCDDYSRGVKTKEYNDDFSSYREGWLEQEEEHPLCGECGEEEAQEGTKPPMCTSCMANAGGGNDPETEDMEGWRWRNTQPKK